MKIRDARTFLDAHPELRIWIRECVRCHRKGYDAALQLQAYPEEIQIAMKRFFKPLEVGPDGLCERCDLIVHRPDRNHPSAGTTDTEVHDDIDD
jgi:hypothetical protein